MPGNLENKIPHELSMEPWISELRRQPPINYLFFFLSGLLSSAICPAPGHHVLNSQVLPVHCSSHPASQLVGKPLLCGTTSDPGGSWRVWEWEVEREAWSNSWVAASWSWSCLLALLCSCEKRHFHPHRAEGSRFLISQWPYYFPDYIWLPERWTHGTLSVGLIISILKTVIYEILIFFDFVFTLGKAKNIVIVWYFENTCHKSKRNAD